MKKQLIAFLLACSVAMAADVTFAWDFNDPEDEATEYRLYEKIGETLELKATVPGTTNSVTITNISPGRRTFIATAVNLWGESDPSNEAKTPPPGQPPKNLKVITVTITVE